MSSAPTAQTESQSPSPSQTSQAKVQLTAIQRTLLVTLHARARDHARPDSQLRDEWAAATVAQLHCDFGPGARLDQDFALMALHGLTWRGVVKRAALLDGWTNEFLAQHPAGATVVHLACGLDSRAWRLRPRGSRLCWVDADLAPVVALRRRCFPDPPPLGKGGEYRLVTVVPTGPPTAGGDKDAMAVDQEADADWLESIPNDRPTLVVMEGLTMYLAPAAAETLLRRVLAHFSSGQLIFDAFGPVPAQLMSRLMGRGPPVAEGGPVGWSITDPKALEALDPRVELLDVHYGLTLDSLSAPVAFVVAFILTLVAYIPFGSRLLEAFVRPAKRMAQFYLLRYGF